jgi:signal transduction histidine kinase
MINSLFERVSQEQVFEEYQEQRRLQMARSIGPILAIINFLATLALGISAFTIPLPNQQLSTVIILIIAFIVMNGCTALYIYGGVEARKDHVKRATISISISIHLVAIAFGTLWDFTQGVGPFGLIAYSFSAIVIVLNAVLVPRFGLILSTLIMNFFFSAVTLLYPRQPGITPLLDQQALLIVVSIILIQWAITSILLILGNTNRQTFLKISELEQAYERARKLDELKDQFISSVNHELRTPVMVVQGNLELLQLTSEIISQDAQKELVNDAVLANDHLKELITSILDIRQIEQKKDDFVPEAVPLLSLIKGTTKLVESAYLEQSERQLYLHVPDQLEILGNTTRLQQVMINLLTNALKYSPPGTPIEISATELKKSDASEVEIRVQDHGFGIPPDQIPLLFNRFVRLPRDLASTISGNGLGLYLCRLYVEAMNGRIWVESSGVPGEGSTFVIRLPSPPANIESLGNLIAE